MNQFKIGVIGNGFVGSAIVRGLNHYFDIKIYDHEIKKTVHSFDETIKQDIVFVCLPTPMFKDTYECDLSYIKNFFTDVITCGFNPNTIFDPSKLTFTIGNYVKITNNNDFTEVVEVTTSTVNSITFDLVTNLPVDELGGLSIQLASNDLFPTTSVLANYYANLSTTGIWITPTNPRENLAVSQMELPVLRYRARQYYLVTKELSDTLPLLSSTTNSLSTTRGRGVCKFINL